MEVMGMAQEHPAAKALYHTREDVAHEDDTPCVSHASHLAAPSGAE